MLAFWLTYLLSDKGMTLLLALHCSHRIFTPLLLVALTVSVNGIFSLPSLNRYSSPTPSITASTLRLPGSQGRAAVTGLRCFVSCCSKPFGHPGVGMLKDFVFVVSAVL